MRTQINIKMGQRYLQIHFMLCSPLQRYSQFCHIFYCFKCADEAPAKGAVRWGISGRWSMTSISYDQAELSCLEQQHLGIQIEYKRGCKPGLNRDLSRISLGPILYRELNNDNEIPIEYNYRAVIHMRNTNTNNIIYDDQYIIYQELNSDNQIPFQYIIVIYIMITKSHMN